MDLHTDRWKDESAAVSDQTFNFHKELVLHLSKNRNYSLFFATYQGKRIASHACIDYGTRREAYFNGRNPDFEELRAGRLLYLHTIFDAIENKFSIYNLGYGGDRYKLSFANKVDEAINIILVPEESSINLSRLFPNFEYVNFE